MLFIFDKHFFFLSTNAMISSEVPFFLRKADIQYFSCRCLSHNMPSIFSRFSAISSFSSYVTDSYFDKNCSATLYILSSYALTFNFLVITS